LFGVSVKATKRTQAGGAIKYLAPIVEEEDLEKLCVADYEVMEKETAALVEQHQNAVGDILEIVVDRQGELCRVFRNDISTRLAHIRGLEQIMWDIYDRPEWLHRLLGFMRDKILMHMEQTEAAGAFLLFNHENQAMPYEDSLRRPSASGESVSQKELWGFVAAQEFTLIGPDAFKEFMFDYQKPIMERYALTAYGCCEDLAGRIDTLKTLSNLRRIAVTPCADVGKCAEQIGPDYISSWRPNPSSAVSFGVDEEFTRREMRAAFDAFDANQCKFDITLKDVETVSGKKDSIPRWAGIVRDEMNKRYG
jgi:hypothetical protein